MKKFLMTIRKRNNSRVWENTVFYYKLLNHFISPNIKQVNFENNIDLDERNSYSLGSYPKCRPLGFILDISWRQYHFTLLPNTEYSL